MEDTKDEKYEEAFKAGMAKVIKELSTVKNHCAMCYSAEYCDACKHRQEYAQGISRRIEYFKTQI